MGGGGGFGICVLCGLVSLGWLVSVVVVMFFGFGVCEWRFFIVIWVFSGLCGVSVVVGWVFCGWCWGVEVVVV